MIYEIYILHCIQQRTNVFKLKKINKYFLNAEWLIRKRKQWKDWKNN